MTYTNFMTQVAIECNLDTSSTSQWTTLVRTRLTQFLNQGMERLWQGDNNRIWPWLQDTSSVAVTDGVADSGFTAVNESVVFTIWDEDPRSDWTTSGTFSASPIPWVRDGTDIRMQSVTSTSVFAFCSIARPVFTIASTTEVVPDNAVRWMLAFIALRNMENSMPSNAEQLLQRAIAREEREWNAMVLEATQTWCKAPWLDWFATYNP